MGPEDLRNLRELVDAGLSNAQIAEEMDLTEKAVLAIRLKLLAPRGGFQTAVSKRVAQPTPRGPVVLWPEEKIERLKVLAKQGWTSSAIAKDLGGVSRSAVLGKLHRLGISLGSAAAVKETIAHTNKQRAKAAAPRHRVEKPAPPRVEPPPSTAPDEGAFDVVDDADERTLKARFARAFTRTAPDGSTGVPYLRRRDTMCCWPLEELHGPPATMCCGAPVRGPMEPYCAHHARIAYQPRQASVKDRDPERARKIALRLALARMGEAKAREAEAAKYRRAR